MQSINLLFVINKADNKGSFLRPSLRGKLALKQAYWFLPINNVCFGKTNFIKKVVFNLDLAT
jgi:hypothetical protein